MTLAIREYRPSDEDQFLSVARDLQAFELGLYDRMMPVEDIGPWYIDILTNQCKKESGFILVAELMDQIVGYATIFTKVQQHGEIDEISFTYGLISHIAVRPIDRGSGIGKQLMIECERRAREAGCKWLRIPALAKNVKAREIYRHIGFEEHLVILEKTLSGA